MTAKEALSRILSSKVTLFDLDDFYTVNEFVDENDIDIINQALTELEAIKSADGGEAMEELKLLDKEWQTGEELETEEQFAHCSALENAGDILENFILKAQAQEEELRELKATIKELLDIPITVSTFNGTSLLVKTMNKLNKLVSDKDE